MKEQEFLAWLAGQKKLRKSTKAWMREACAKLQEHRDKGEMSLEAFDISVDLLRAMAQSHVDGTEEETYAFIEESFRRMKATTADNSPNGD